MKGGRLGRWASDAPVFGLDQQVCARLDDYAALLGRYNGRYRLVADLEWLATHHILDSLAGLATVRSRAVVGRVVDVGSGAGLPGLPLALAAPELHITLVERSARRARFLRLAVAELGLTSRCRVLEQDFERLSASEAAPDHDLFVCRGVAAVGDLLRMMRRLAARNACVHSEAALIAYKGRADVLTTELAGITQPYEVLPVRVPGVVEERHVVVVSGPWR